MTVLITDFCFSTSQTWEFSSLSYILLNWDLWVTYCLSHKNTFLKTSPLSSRKLWWTFLTVFWPFIDSTINNLKNNQQVIKPIIKWIVHCSPRINKQVSENDTYGIGFVTLGSGTLWWAFFTILIRLYETKQWTNYSELNQHIFPWWKLFVGCSSLQNTLRFSTVQLCHSTAHLSNLG